MKLFISSVYSVRMLQGHVNVAFTRLPTIDEVVGLVNTVIKHGGEIENIQHERSARHLALQLTEKGITLPDRLRRDIVWPEEKGDMLLIINEGKDKSFVYWLCTQIVK